MRTPLLPEGLSKGRADPPAIHEGFSVFGGTKSLTRSHLVPSERLDHLDVTTLVIGMRPQVLHFEAVLFVERNRGPYAAIRWGLANQKDYVVGDYGMAAFQK